MIIPGSNSTNSVTKMDHYLTSPSALQVSDFGNHWINYRNYLIDLLRNIENMKGVVEFPEDYKCDYKEEYLHLFYLVWRSLKNVISSNYSTKHRGRRIIMNIKYKHGITDQGKEMLVTQDLEGVSSPSVSGWTLRRRDLYTLAFLSICVTIIVFVAGM